MYMFQARFPLYRTLVSIARNMFSFPKIYYFFVFMTIIIIKPLCGIVRARPSASNKNMQLLSFNIFDFLLTPHNI